MANEVVWSGENTVFGNKRMAIGTVTMSGLVSGAAYVGLGVIAGGTVSLRAQTENTSYTVSYNVASGATATNGMIRIQSAVAADVFDVQLWGN